MVEKATRHCKTVGTENGWYRVPCAFSRFFDIIRDSAGNRDEGIKNLKVSPNIKQPENFGLILPRAGILDRQKPVNIN